MQIIVFTDMDGTLLDEMSYSFEKALPAINRLKERGIPLILVSSKTKREIMLYQQKLGIREPFVFENGGGIGIPKDYFDMPLPVADRYEGYHILPLGTPHFALMEVFGKIKEESGGKLEGMSDMTIPEIIEYTGLNESEAILAASRDFGEPFIFLADDKKLKDMVFEKIKDAGLKHTKGGRFYFLIGDNNKGKASEVLKSYYQAKYGEKIVTIGLGDSYNDLPLLQFADYPILIKKNAGYYEDINLPGVIKSNKAGPEGWNKTVLALLCRLLPENK